MRNRRCHQRNKESTTRGDYYKAISLSCSYFQYLGKRLLGYKLDKIVDLAKIISKLRLKGLIDKKICDGMDKVRKLERNDLQHNGTAFEYNTKLVRVREDLTALALECLECFQKNARMWSR
jgi:HEPN domain-containing protein